MGLLRHTLLGLVLVIPAIASCTGKVHIKATKSVVKQSYSQLLRRLISTLVLGVRSTLNLEVAQILNLKSKNRIPTSRRTFLR